MLALLHARIISWLAMRVYNFVAIWGSHEACLCNLHAAGAIHRWCGMHAPQVSERPTRPLI